MKCDECNKEASFIVVTNNRDYCEKCAYELFPPTLILAMTTEDKLYNKNSRMFEPSIEELSKCGFQLYIRKIFKTPVGSLRNGGLRFKELLTFKYRGESRCNKVGDDYTLWPVMMNKCSEGQVACWNK